MLREVTAQRTKKEVVDCLKSWQLARERARAHESQMETAGALITMEAHTKAERQRVALRQCVYLIHCVGLHYCSSLVRGWFVESMRLKTEMQLHSLKMERSDALAKAREVNTKIEEELAATALSMADHRQKEETWRRATHQAAVCTVLIVLGQKMKTAALQCMRRWHLAMMWESEQERQAQMAGALITMEAHTKAERQQVSLRQWACLMYRAGRRHCSSLMQIWLVESARAAATKKLLDHQVSLQQDSHTMNKDKSGTI